MSTQNTETPTEFLLAVEKCFGIRFKYDMAAGEENAKVPNYYSEKDDSLSIDWPTDGWCWLNPPFRRLTKWVRKCKEQMDRGCKIISIWPLSGDKNQIITWKHSLVCIIHGRIWPLVRGCMLCIWDKDLGEIEWKVSGVSWDGEKLSIEWSK